jgi:glyoxylase-like metal-dependent hydrolase (beta-lactamase superfamily II)
MQIVLETENLYRLTRFGVFNSFLVREGSAFTLVDTNFPGSATAILQVARTLGAPITRIALTHAHFDHVGSLDELTRVLPDVEVSIATREARLLHGDFSLDPGETGKPFFGFKKVTTRAHRLLNDGDHVGSLRAVACPGHTPGHMAFLDERDNSLLAGDSYVTQTGVIAAGVFSVFFPMPAWFSWNPVCSARSAAKLAALKPTRLAVGHGKTIVSPGAQMDRAVEMAFRQHPDARLT